MNGLQGSKSPQRPRPISPRSSLAWNHIQLDPGIPRRQTRVEVACIQPAWRLSKPETPAQIIFFVETGAVLVFVRGDLCPFGEPT